MGINNQSITRQLIRCCAVLIIVLISFHLSAQQVQNAIKEKLTINLDCNDEDGVVYDDKLLLSYLEIENHSDEEISLKIEWRITSDNWQPLMQLVVPSKVGEKTKTKVYLPMFRFPGPGFYHISGTVTTQYGNTYNASQVIAINPEKILAPLNAQPDFDSFWESSLNELAAIDPNVKITSQKRTASTKTNLYKVELKSFGGLTVRGWLEVPKKQGIYPALIRVPGYEGNMEPIDKYEDLIIFSFNPRDHGESDNTGERNYAMWVRGMESKEEYFYRGIFLDCIRAVDFLVSRKDVDKTRIAMWGGSQGGGLSFATAALDNRIDLCIADIPFLCEWQRYFEITHWPEVDIWFDHHPKQNWQSMLETLSYFDTKNLAKKITCPVIMGIGLQDDVCPPATSFVTYNYIQSPKEYTVYKYDGHSQPGTHYENRFLMLRKAFNMD